ncbi:Protein BZZ1 [Entomophthora muscae]|uniref:Protein BZZ1 n=1 Tax=Entomophthora muscae TaxID=34485 RepID=A0ACC2RJW5_9FUNG|nr:Protein BZZ1 [Entomophthora muscae]
MSFGEQLKADQVIQVSRNVAAGIELIQAYREFLKERAALERDYGARLEALTKRYRSHRAFGLGSLAVSQDPFEIHQTSSLTDVSSVLASSTPANNLGLDPEQSTLLKALSSILYKTEKIAGERTNLAERLTTELHVSLKALITRTEEKRKKAFEANKRLTEEYEAAIEEKNRAKALYEESCLEVQSSLAKQEKAHDTKTLDKLNRQYFHEVIDRNNNKNLYILAVQVANQIQAKHFDKNIPEMLNHFQILNERWMIDFKVLLQQQGEMELECTSESKDRVEEWLSVISGVDHNVETALIASSGSSAWTRPQESKFEAFIEFQEDDTLIEEEASKVFMFNKLRKAQAQLRELESTIKIKNKELEGLETLYTAYSENPSLGNASEVHENIFTLWRDLTLLRNVQVSRQTEADLILGSMGNPPSGQMHEFKASSFTIPTTCDYCESTIWGLSRHGATCKECGYNCHAKCELKAPLNCSLVKGGSKADKRPPADLSTISAKTAPFLKTSTRTPLPNAFLEPPKHSEPVLDTAVALYDYDAADDGELTIRENQKLDIIAADDGSGWVTARLDGKTGLVPATYITSSADTAALIVQALYDYDAQTDSDLTIREGEMIEVTNQEVSEGWWEGKLNGHIGLFPANYVKMI